MSQAKERYYQTADLRGLGICATCNYVESCTQRKTWKGPVMFCEEFDDRVALVQKKPADTAKDTDNTNPGTQEVTGCASKHRGLCLNCLHRDACTLPRAEGGVWHCEEYE